jgi:isoleucyl-tRNA synthetase
MRSKRAHGLKFGVICWDAAAGKKLWQADELRLEGLARELVRRIQDLRKQAGYRVEDRIQVCFEIAGPDGKGGSSGPDPREVLKRYCAYIQAETLATELTSGRREAVDRGEEVAVEKEMKIWVGVRKV